jgi:hypothetical protein
MYKILGGDQKEYGPVTADQVRQWIAEQRADGRTQVMVEGGSWQPLSSLPEFAEALAAAGASPPPPPAAGLGGGSAGPGEIRARVQGPAIGLIVTGGISLVLYLFSLFAHLLGWTFAQPASTGNPEIDRVIGLFSGGVGAVVDLLAMVLSVLILVGGLRMLHLKNYPLCVVAAVVALVPCISPCCCLGLPIGIWALVILLKPEVKALFVS